MCCGDIPLHSPEISASRFRSRKWPLRYPTFALFCHVNNVHYYIIVYLHWFPWPCWQMHILLGVRSSTIENSCRSRSQTCWWINFSSATLAFVDCVSAFSVLICWVMNSEPMSFRFLAELPDCWCSTPSINILCFCQRCLMNSKYSWLTSSPCLPSMQVTRWGPQRMAKLPHCALGQRRGLWGEITVRLWSNQQFAMKSTHSYNVYHYNPIVRCYLGNKSYLYSWAIDPIYKVSVGP